MHFLKCKKYEKKRISSNEIEEFVLTIVWNVMGKGIFLISLQAAHKKLGKRFMCAIWLIKNNNNNNKNCASIEEKPSSTGCKIEKNIQNKCVKSMMRSMLRHQNLDVHLWKYKKTSPSFLFAWFFISLDLVTKQYFTQ